METVLFIALFLLSCGLMVLAGGWLVKSLSKISEILGLKEFTIAFLLMSLATATPELMIGISSVFRGISELSLGNILGQNIIHFTVAVFVCVLALGKFTLRTKVLRTAAFFSSFMALFPLILILDGSLSRIDGFILVLTFIVYVTHMLRRGRRFGDLYTLSSTRELTLFKKLEQFFKNAALFLAGAVLLILASQGIVKASLFFATSLDLPIILIGILIVGLGTALPEIFFSVYSARHREGELMAGNLFGSTVVSTSLVLGLVAIFSPIEGIPFFSYFISRFILFISVTLFLVFTLNDRKISKKEGLALFLIYLLFVVLELFA